MKPIPNAQNRTLWAQQQRADPNLCASVCLLKRISLVRFKLRVFFVDFVLAMFYTYIANAQFTRSHETTTPMSMMRQSSEEIQKKNILMCQNHFLVHFVSIYLWTSSLSDFRCAVLVFGCAKSQGNCVT